MEYQKEERLVDIKSYSILDSTRKLIGHTSIACESNWDGESLKNLEDLEDVLLGLLDDLRDNYDYRSRCEFSCQMIVKRSKEILKEVRDLTDVIEEDLDENL